MTIALFLFALLLWCIGDFFYSCDQVAERRGLRVMAISSARTRTLDLATARPRYLSPSRTLVQHLLG